MLASLISLVTNLWPLRNGAAFFLPVSLVQALRPLATWSIGEATWHGLTMGDQWVTNPCSPTQNQDLESKHCSQIMTMIQNEHVVDRTWLCVEPLSMQELYVHPKSRLENHRLRIYCRTPFGSFMKTLSRFQSHQPSSPVRSSTAPCNHEKLMDIHQPSSINPIIMSQPQLSSFPHQPCHFQPDDS